MASTNHDLAEYASLLEGLSRDHLELIRAAWPDAQRAFTRDGLGTYLRAVRSLESIGVTWSAIVTFLREAPRLAREVGERSVEGMLETALAVYGFTSQGVMDAFFAACPLAGRRLREPRQFAAFLKLVTEIAERAPRGVGPMLVHVDTLLEHLTVIDLRTWALLGIQSHSRDPFAQENYFGLETPESRAFLRADSGGVLFNDVRRRMGLYLRALWGKGRELRPFPATLQANRPYITALGIHLPDAYRAARGQTGIELYRAATAHAAAHLAFSPAKPMSRSGLKPIQIVLAGLLEDARVELLAIREVPGLRRLWLRFHEAKAEGSATFAGLATRLARALLDPQFQDDSPWVQKGRRLFFDPSIDLEDSGFPRRLASLLGNDIGQMRLQFNGKTYVVEPMYRDDNTFLWEPDTSEKGMMLEEEVMLVKPELVEQEGGDTLENPDADEQEEGIKPVGESAPDEEAPAAAEVLRVARYPEWDYMINLARPQWCTVQEKRPEPGDPELIDGILRRNEDLLARVDKLIRGNELLKPVRLRKQMDGDRFDLDAVVSAMVDVRTKHTPDQRFHVRIDRRERDLSVLVLLDLSQSTNDIVKASNARVLDLAREATVLLATAMDKIGDQFAIHGFCSNGRHEVQYYRFKDFSWPFDAHVKARLAGMRGQLSTRMGGAIRHAAHLLRMRRSDKKLILLITDGEPHDIDVHDPKYLQLDTKKAVDEASRHGILTYCMSADPKADEYVSRIFGARNYMVVDHINRLPEKLPGLYLRLTR
jgi:nitric oxide reductase activation protein